jgi:hypothetical protein
MMSTHKDVVAEYYAAFNRRNPQVYNSLFTPDCIIAAPGMEGSGVDTLKAFDHVWASAFSEARIESLRMSESDDTVLSSNWFHGGTHVQPLQTAAGVIPASGRSFSAPYCTSFQFDGDRIKAQRLVFDAGFLATALGVPPQPSSLDVVTAIYESFRRRDESHRPERRTHLRGLAGSAVVRTFPGS